MRKVNAMGFSLHGATLASDAFFPPLVIPGKDGT